jgi:AcrR family transcriptional regulator
VKTEPRRPVVVKETRPAGRPRSEDVDEAILSAAVELLTSVGPDATTISGVVRRSGIARASVYLRYPNRDALVAAAVKRVIGRAPSPLGGDIAEDLKTGADQTQVIFDSPEFQTLLPMIIRGLLRPDGHPGTLTYDTVVPNRRLVAEAYGKLAAAAGFRTDIDSEIVVDLVIGGLLSHLLAKGSAPSPAVVQRMVDVVVDGLRERPGARSPRTQQGALRKGPERRVVDRRST